MTDTQFLALMATVIAMHTPHVYDPAAVVEEAHDILTAAKRRMYGEEK